MDDTHNTVYTLDSWTNAHTTIDYTYSVHTPNLATLVNQYVYNSVYTKVCIIQTQETWTTHVLCINTLLFVHVAVYIGTCNLCEGGNQSGVHHSIGDPTD